mgnify:CR=1 FL=1
MFPAKAVAILQNLSDNQRAQLIAFCFVKPEGWSQPTAWDVSPDLGLRTDPVLIVSADKLDSRAAPGKWLKTIYCLLLNDGNRRNSEYLIGLPTRE